MDKKLLIVLIMVFAAGVFISGFYLPAYAFSGILILTLMLIIVPIIILLWSVNPLKRNSETEIIGIDAEATTDSRISKTMTSFIGIPIFIVFGGLWGKYESVFSVRHGGGAVVVLYNGMCIVSKNDRLRIIGKWYNGKKVGIKGNFVIASRVENISSGIVFDTGK